MAIDRYTDAVPEPYAGSTPPYEPTQLPDFLTRELGAVTTALQSVGDLAPQVADVAPSNPRRGQVRYGVAPWSLGWVWYDGTTWRPLAGSHPNSLINGNFDIWQRGTSLSAGAGYRLIADRWHISSGGTTYSASQQALSPGQGVVPNEPRFYQRVITTSAAGASNFCYLGQKVEEVRTLAGQQATLRFWAKADAARSIAVELTQWFGTGGSPSGEVQAIGSTKVTLSTTWAQYSVSASIPSIAGKTRGANGDDCLILYFWMDAGSSFDARTQSLGPQSGTFDIAQVHLGPAGSSFTPRTFGHELALCQRFYEKSYDIDTNPGTVTQNGSHTQYLPVNTTGGDFNVRFHVPKRVVPTVTCYSPVTGTPSRIGDATTSTDLTPTVDFRGHNGFRAFYTTPPQWQNASMQWVADAEL